MSPICRWFCLGLGLWLVCIVPAFAQEKPPKKPWTGKPADGRVINETDLDKILQEHKLWIESKWQKGKRANLGEANLRGAWLRKANLSEADLWNSNLSGADLREANLSGANLAGADLSKANLIKANLIRANLQGAHLIEANLRNATLNDADMREAVLNGSRLRKANLSGARLWYAKLNKAELMKAKLNKAELWKAELKNALLRGAILIEARLSETNLNKTDLRDANLRKTKILNTNLKKASLERVELNGAIFEPQPGTVPGVVSLLGIKGLDSLTFTGNSSFGLMELRKTYKEAGMRDEERQVTFSLNYTRREHLWAEKGVFSKLESLFQLVFFEWTCQYGLSPGRPLQIMGWGLLLFIFPYLLALGSRDPETGLWLLLPPDRVLDRKIKGRPFKLSNIPLGWSWPMDDWARGKANIWLDIRSLRLAFYFSLLSAFHIGWRELNVGAWITRLQCREYNLRATGWVRFFSGLQSLISVYMLALWALSYFGRPFE